jgi:hypothetical protein
MTNLIELNKIRENRLEKTIRVAINCEMNLRRKEENLKELEKINPNNPYFILGLACCSLEDYCDSKTQGILKYRLIGFAYKNIVKVIKKNPKNEEAAVLKLKISAELAQNSKISYEKYEKRIEKALELHPYNKQVLLHAFHFYKEEINNFKKWNKILKIGLKFHPDNFTEFLTNN